MMPRRHAPLPQDDRAAPRPGIRSAGV